MRYNYLFLFILATNISAAAFGVKADEIASTHSDLVELVRATLNSNPGVQSAQAALDAAMARERAGYQPLYNPELDVDAEDAVDQSASIGISQSIDWSNKRGARGQISSFERETAVAELQAVRQTLAVELLNAITQHNVTTNLLTIASDRERLMREFTALAVQRREVGDLNQVDLDLARLALAEAQLQRAQASFVVVGAWQAVVAVLGEAPGVLPKTPDNPPVLDASPDDIEQLLHALPAMQAQMARIATAKSVMKLRQLEKRPDPTVGVRVGQEESDLLAGVNISIPLFVRNTFQAEVDGASADLIQVEQAGLDMFRRIRARMVAARDRYQLTNSAWRNWTSTGLLSLRNQIGVTGTLWRAGEISTTDYLVQLRQALDTEVAATELYGDLWQAWFDWLAASGQVDAWLGLARSP